MAIDWRSMVGTHDLCWLTFDTLRYDVAQAAHRGGETPFLSSLLGPAGWEERETPATFTYAAHHAFFAGFGPTPPGCPHHPRSFAAAFAGSESIDDRTWAFDEADVVGALAARGYGTICIGGVGFFNRRTALGRVLPSLFEESHWSPELGVTAPDSAANQVALALERLRALGPGRRCFLFVNLSAMHQPNCHYVPGATVDSAETQRAALAYVDAQLAPLFEALRLRGPGGAVLLSDHGTSYGDDGRDGHRHAHPSVWRVPYAEVVWS